MNAITSVRASLLPARTRRSNKARRLIDVSLLLSVAVCAHLSYDAYAWSNPMKPDYIVFGKGMESRKVPGFRRPVLNKNDLLRWTARWVLAPLNVNYHDHKLQMSDASEHYSSEGWSDFEAEYKSTGNEDKMEEGRLTCYAQKTRDAVLVPSPFFAGPNTYTVQIPVIQTCENVNEEHSQHLLVTATVDRVSDVHHPDGLVIDRLLTKVK